jgi:hypothetical protein
VKLGLRRASKFKHRQVNDCDCELEELRACMPTECSCRSNCTNFFPSPQHHGTNLGKFRFADGLWHDGCLRIFPAEREKRSFPFHLFFLFRVFRRV